MLCATVQNVAARISYTRTLSISSNIKLKLTIVLLMHFQAGSTVLVCVGIVPGVLR